MGLSPVGGQGAKVIRYARVGNAHAHYIRRYANGKRSALSSSVASFFCEGEVSTAIPGAFISVIVFHCVDFTGSFSFQFVVWTMAVFKTVFGKIRKLFKLKNGKNSPKDKLSDPKPNSDW